MTHRCEVAFVAMVLAVTMAQLGTAPIGAQSGTASISGRVADSQGGVLPGVSVTIVRVATSASRATITNASGVYQFTGLVPGEYQLTVSLEGFRTTVLKDLELLVDTQARHNVELELGELTESLVVTATAALINTTDASIGNAFDENTIKSLPVEGRSVVELLSLQPGAVFIPFSEGTTDDEDPRFGAVSGARADQQNVTLDGVDVNDPELQTAYTSAVRISQDALQEFRVSTSNYGADYGHSSGPQVSMVTKSGTNDFEGSAYWLARRTGTSSNEFFLKLAQTEAGLPSEAPKLEKDIFGASFGGPIADDRVFFFVNYEHLDEQSERPVVRSVPSGSFRDGVLIYECEVPAACPGGPVNGFNNTHTVPAGWYGLTPGEVAAIDPLGIGPSQAASDYFSRFPLPNEPGLDGVNIMDFRFPSPLENNFKNGILRMDARLTNSQQLFLRYAAQDDTINDPEQYPGDGPRSQTFIKNWGVALGHDWVISNNLINTFRYGHTSIDEETRGRVDSNLVDFRFISDLIPDTFNESRETPTDNIVEKISWLKGNHTFEAGLNFRSTEIPSNRETSSWLSATVNPSWVNGVGRTYQPGRPGCTTPGCDAVPAVASTFQAGYADAWLNLLGVLSQANLNANYLTDGTLLDVGTPVGREYAVDEVDYHIQDSWLVTPNLTVTLGLRYALYEPPYEVNGQQVAPNIAMGDWFAERAQNMQAGIPSSASPLIEFDLAGPANGRRGFYEEDTDNFGPAFALAWTPNFNGKLKWLTGDRDLVIRTGYTKVFDRVGLGLARQFDRFFAFGMSTGISSPFGLAYEEDPNARFIDISTMPPHMPLAPPGGFPQRPPVGANIITGSIDGKIETPSAEVVNLTFARQLGSNYSIEAAYVGRFGRDQLVRRDLAMPLNLTDTVSGMDYFSGVREIINAAQAAGLTANSPLSDYAGLAPVAYWENLFPGLAADGFTSTQVAAEFFNFFSPDYITALFLMDQFCVPSCSIHGPFAYFAQQYDSLAGISTIGRSNYNALQLTIRRRFHKGFKFDINYTLAKSKDMASAVERGAAFGNFGNGGYTGFLINSFEPDLSYGPSDYDVRHQVNANWIYELPYRNTGAKSGLLRKIFGDWAVSGLVRWTSGFPFNVFNCRSCWATNWNLQGNAELVNPGVLPPTGTTYDAVDGRPSPFSDPVAARDFFRTALPGEVGIRNLLRGDGFFSIDLSFSKTIRLRGDHELQFRADVFNATNTPSFDVDQTTMFPDRSGFGRYDGTYATCDGLAGRCMQFSLRYQF